MKREDLKIARPDLAGVGVTKNPPPNVKPLDIGMIRRNAVAAERARIASELRRWIIKVRPPHSSIDTWPFGGSDEPAELVPWDVIERICGPTASDEETLR